MSSFDTYDVYVANLPFDVTESIVKELFALSGDVQGVNILPQKDGTNGRVAFIRFKQEDDAECAAKYMNNTVLDDGRKIIVRYKKKEGSNDKMLNGRTNGSSSNDFSGFNGNSEIENRDCFPASDNLNGHVNGTNGSHEGELVTGLVVHIESPIEFWTQNTNVDTFTKLQEVATQLEDLCPSQAKVVGQLSTHQVYACKFSSDNMWYRCVVEKCLQKNMAQVRYIDYGNIEEVERFSLVTLPASLSTLPPLARCCQLNGLELVDKGSSSAFNTKGIEKITTLIADQILDMEIIYKEKQMQFVKVLNIQNSESADVFGNLLETGAVKCSTRLPRKAEKPAIAGLRDLLVETVTKNYDNIKAREDKIKDFHNGFSFVAPPNNKAKSPFNVLKTSSSTEKSTLCPPTNDTESLINKLNQLEMKVTELETEKGKVESKLKACEKHQQQVVFELETKLRVCSEDKDKNVSEMMEKLEISERNKVKALHALQNEKDDVLQNAVSAKFKSLLGNVKMLRQHRVNSSSIDEAFVPEMQSIIDLYVNTDSKSIVCLSTTSQYQSIQIEQDALRVQKDLLVKCCENDREELQELIEEKEDIVRKCAKHVQNFLKYLSTLPLQQRHEDLSRAMQFLKNNYPKLLPENEVEQSIITLLETKSLERAVLDYKAEKKLLAVNMRRFRDLSNEGSSKVFKTIGQLQRECHCVVSINTISELDNIDELIQKYQQYMKQEIEEIQRVEDEFTSSSTLKDVVILLGHKISQELKDVEYLKSEELKESYEKLLSSYKKVLKNKPATETVMQARAQIKRLKSKFRHKQADITDLEEDLDDIDEKSLQMHMAELDEIRLQLHQQFLIELGEMRQLAEASQNDFPELTKIHPELSIPAFIESGCLLQKNRTIDHYPQDMVVLATRKNEITYKSVFNGQPCVTKEITILSNVQGQTYKDILSSVVDYSQKRHESWANFQCIFTDKAVRKLYLHQDYASEGNIQQFVNKHHPSMELMKGLVKEILYTLDCSIPHGDIKRENVLISKKNDDSFHAYLAQPNFLEKKDALLSKCLNVERMMSCYPVLKDIEREVSHKTDVACVGGILFWALRKGSFTENLQDDLREVEDPLLKDLLRQMFAVNPTDRITASEVLQHPYFYLESSNKSKEDPAVLVNTLDESKEEVNGNSEETHVMVTKATIVDDAINSSVERLSISVHEAPQENKSEIDLSVILSEDVDFDISPIKGGTVDEDEDADGEIHAWAEAISKKKEAKKKLGEIFDEKPQDVPISDDDDF